MDTIINTQKDINDYMYTLNKINDLNKKNEYYSKNFTKREKKIQLINHT